MALPSINDLLPDHLFNQLPSSTTRPPPPPASLSPLRPLYPQHEFTPIHHTRDILPLAPPRLSQSLQSGFSLSHPTRPFREETINERRLVPDNAHAVRFIRDDLPDDGARHDRGVFFNAYNSGNGHTPGANIFNGLNESDHQNKKHTCPTCGKGFNRPSSLRIHANTHTGAKPYPCPFPGCGRSFNVSSNMRRHYRSHNNVDLLPPPIDTLTRCDSGATQNVPHGIHTVSFLPASQPPAYSAIQRYGPAVYLLDDAAREPMRERNPHIVRDGSHEVHYEYPCSSGSWTNTHYRQASLPRPEYAQPAFPHAHPTAEDREMSSDKDYRLRNQDHELIRRGPTPKLLYSPSGERRTYGVYIDVPPTPPYTNEAAISPPTYTSRLAPLPQSSLYPASNAVAHQYDGSTMPRMEPRQQLSPDTPDRLAPRFHDDQPSVPSSVQEEIIESGFDKLDTNTPEDRYVAAKEIPAKRHRSSLSLSELLHPNHEPIGLGSYSAASPSDSHSRCSRVTPYMPSTSSLPLGSPGSATSTRATSPVPGKSGKPGSESPRRKQLLGTTPGAAPPPPYPLLALPPSIDDEDGDEPMPSGRRKPSKARKRRRRK